MRAHGGSPSEEQGVDLHTGHYTKLTSKDVQEGDRRMIEDSKVLALVLLTDG